MEERTPHDQEKMSPTGHDGRSAQCNLDLDRCISHGKEVACAGKCISFLRPLAAYSHFTQRCLTTEAHPPLVETVRGIRQTLVYALL